MPRALPRVVVARRRWLEWPALPGEGELQVDVEIGGLRLWSGRTERPGPRTHRMPWPRALLPYLSGGGVVVVRAADGEVLATGRYSFGEPRLGRDLRSLGQAGLVVDKWGKLAAAPSEDLHSVLLHGLDEVVAALQAADYAVSITGGTLLGAIRSGDIIERDDDADVFVYLGEVGPADVSLASYGIQRVLEASGRTVVRHSDAHLQVIMAGERGRAHVDVFLGFHHEGSYHQPIAVRGELPVEAILPLGTARLAGREFPAVADPERWLALCYGAGWRTPDPSFRFRTPSSTRRRFENWFGVYDLNRHFWEDWIGRAASSWHGDADELDRLLPRDSRVIDLGSGIGENARLLAERGHRVLAADYALGAVTAAEQLSGGRFEVQRVNAADRRDLLGLGAAELEAGGQPNVLLSDVLAYLTRDIRANVFRFLDLVLGTEGRAVASFPVNPSLHYEHARPDTWHLPLAWLRDEIASSGLRFEVRGTGYRRTSAGLRRFATVVIERGQGA
ncbi:hypothetical protein ROT00_09235 [Agromyces mediolanus]|uniref:hypothetical protein n=1 Tax=Agromyces mediolanus TaxID=41986 RepID=UPI00383566B7